MAKRNHRLLVTGSRGYIGTHLLPLFPDAETCDLKDGQNYRDVTGEEFDIVIHLAASVSVTESILHPEKYFANNTTGVEKFLQRNTIGRFIFASTGGAMYGNRRGALESDSDMSFCQSPYALSKLAAEKIIGEYQSDAVILRLANVYGGDYSVRGEAACHAHFETDDPIVVYGGEQTRDFIHVSRVVSAFKRATECQSGTYNIGSGDETRILDLALEASERRGVPVELRPKREGEVDFISLDIREALRRQIL